MNSFQHALHGKVEIDHDVARLACHAEIGGYTMSRNVIIFSDGTGQAGGAASMKPAVTSTSSIVLCAAGQTQPWTRPIRSPSMTQALALRPTWRKAWSRRLFGEYVTLDRSL